MKIVFDSSPLIFLSKLNWIETFFNTERQNYISQAVASEIQEKNDKANSQVIALILNNQLQVIQLSSSSLVNQLTERLGKGESEAIALAIQLQSDYVIIDDNAARKEAIKLGLKVKGTLAIIKKMEQEQKVKLDNLEQFYQQLQRINFRVNYQIFKAIFED